MKPGAVLFAAIAMSLIVGAGAGYFGGRLSTGGATTVTNTSVSTIVSTVTTSATGQTTGVDFQAALNNTVAPDLAVTSYSFGKGTLTAFMLNNGTEPFVITAHVPLLNGTTDTISKVISLDPKVVHFGSYLYIPAGSTFIVSVDAQSYIQGQKGVLTIYGDSWTFVYGTQKD